LTPKTKLDKKMEQNKGILILKASDDICGNEIGLISHQCKLLGIEVCENTVGSENDIINLIAQYQGKVFNYIYLCTHGDKEGFAADIDSSDNKITWARFSELICTSKIFDTNTIFLLACCKGGLFRVASDIMAICNKINIVCGVKWNVRAFDLTTGFLVFLYNIEVKNSEPYYAAQKASLATDFSFTCYDRDEIEISPQYQQRRLNLLYEIGWIDINGNWVSENEVAKENSGFTE
jgi:hypothetical protein